MVASARAAWPTVNLDPDRFVAHLETKLASLTAPDSLGSLRTDDLYLACGCLLGIPAALAAFEAHLMPAVEQALRRVRLQPSTLDEIRQVVRTRLLVGGDGRGPRIGEYGGRGELRAWVRVVATRVALNSLRDDRVEVLSDSIIRAAAAPESGNPELAHIKHSQAEALRAAFRLAVETLPAVERARLHQHYVEGMTAERIGKRERRHRVTISRRIERTLRELRLRTVRLLQRDLDCDRAAAESIVQAALSQIAVSSDRFATIGRTSRASTS
jgi:RNA polymerase sigma-70 factor (ECF subfamily)